MLSNICFSGRAVAAKRLYTVGDKPDETLLFARISVLGLVLLVPMAFVMDRNVVLDHNWDVRGQDTKFQFLGTLLLNSLAYTTYNLASFLVLSRTNLVTHAVLNACRRVVIILFSAWFFSVHISSINVWGIVISILGVVWFAVSKSQTSKTASVVSLLPSFLTDRAREDVNSV